MHLYTDNVMITMIAVSIRRKKVFFSQVSIFLFIEIISASHSVYRLANLDTKPPKMTMPTPERV